MSHPISVALVGVTGYGSNHARRFLELQAQGAVRLTAFVEPAPERNQGIVNQLREAGARHYPDLAGLPSTEPVEAAVIATPIHLHRTHCLAALSRGWHVFVEKPAAATIQDLHEMVAASRRAARIVAVNFQRTAKPGFRTLLGLLRAGRIGTVRSVTGWGIWQRDDVYYSRSRWVGRLRVGDHWVLDGTVMNSLAHLINNALIAASSDLGRPAPAARVTAELYHANPIEAEDTACLRITTAEGKDVLIFTTLAGPDGMVPGLRVTGTAGMAEWDFADRLRIAGPDGTWVEIPAPAPGPDHAENFLAAVRGEPVALYSPLADSIPHLTVANGAFLSAWPPAAVPEAHKRQEPTGQSTLAWQIPGIAEWIGRAVDEAKLFSELGVPWASAGRPVDLRSLHEFAPEQEG
ncbi:MAG: Gfo/Idh/MocA family protein [Bacillota bacterium]